MQEVGNLKTALLVKNIEKWKERLLDLSKRNQLVNFKYNKKRVLKINNDIFELYERLIDKEKIKNIEKLHLDYDLDNDLHFKEFQAVTKKLRQVRNTVMNEKGINILYLTLGMLTWKDHENSEDPLYAPLLLLPVELYQANRNTPMELRVFEDQMIVNPSLQFKLKNEFGLVLPPFEEIEDLNHYIKVVRTYLSNIRNTVDIELLEESFLALLQFSKLALYQDMETYKDLIEAHPIVSNIASLQKVYESDISEKLDTINPEVSTVESFQILDADSSQIEAIIAAKNKFSYVLQGPPGTGKSQTISNVIAECMAKGQKVLFVSEKVAALNVVYKRLSQMGLDDYCLELHSNKSNKKQVVTSLYDSYISNSKKNPRYNSDLLDTVERNKKIINKYVQALHSIQTEYKKSAYDVHGHLASLSEVPTVAFEIPNAISDAEFNKILYLLDQSLLEGESISKFKNSVWNGIKEDNWSLMKETLLKENLSIYLALLKRSNIIAKQLASQYNLKICSFNQLLKLWAIYEDFSDNKEFLVDEWLLKQKFNEQFEYIAAYKRTFKRTEEVEQELLGSFTSLDIPNVSSANLLSIEFAQGFINRRSTIAIEAISAIQALVKKIEEENLLNPIAPTLIISSFQDIERIQPFFNLLRQGRQIPQEWINDEHFFETIHESISYDYLQAQNIKNQQNKLNRIVALEKIDSEIISNIVDLNSIDLESHEVYKYCYENVNSIVENIIQCINHMEKINHNFNLLREKIEMNREITLNNSYNLLNIFNITSEIVFCDEDWLEGIGLKAIERVHNEFFELQKKINVCKKELLEDWREEVIKEFEDDPSIYNRFRDEYSSILRIVKNKYHSDKKKLTNLLLEEQKISYETIYTKLKIVKQYHKLLNKFKENEHIYKESMGSLYDSLNTEKTDIERNMQAIRDFKDSCISYGLTVNQMKKILTLKNWVATDFYDLKNEIAAAINYLRENHSQLHIQLRGSYNLNTQPIEDLRNTLLSKIKYIQKLVSQIQTVKIILKESFGFEEFKGNLVNIESYQNDLYNFQDNYDEFKQKYLNLFDYTNTDWEEIKRTVCWWKEVNTYLFNDNILHKHRASIKSFVSIYNKDIVDYIDKVLEENLNNFKESLNNLNYITSTELLNQFYKEKFISISESLSSFKDTALLLHSLLENIERIRKEKWVSPDQTIEDFKIISNYEILSNEMKQYDLKNKKILNLNFDVTTEGFNKIENQLIFNRNFIDSLKENRIDYNSLILEWVNSHHIEMIRVSQDINLSASKMTEYFEPLLDNYNQYSQMEFDEQIKMIELKLNSIDEVEMIIKIKKIFKELNHLNLYTMVEKFLNDNVLWDFSLKEVFLKRYYEQALDEIYLKTPELANFNKEDFERVLQLFREGDQEQFSENAKRINLILRDQINEKLAAFHINQGE